MLRRVTLVFLLLLVVAAPASALPGAHISATNYVKAASYPGMQHLHYEFGPVAIKPGQNNIDFAVNNLKPQVPGYITRFSPNLVYAKDHTIPRVDVIHLHHGVWLIGGQPAFAAGEEKTRATFPQGYGFHSNPKTPWIMNHMIHNLTPSPTSVYITYDIDFVPDSDPAAASITPVKPLWLDVAGIRAYPVFDAVRGTGHHGRYTFPDDAKGAQARKIGPAHSYRAPEDMTLVSTAGHLHPGGLYNDLFATRGDTTKRLFRSVAKYFEPAGAVSWDVSMTGTTPDWRVTVNKGDELSTAVTYDVSKASWYESMGIMVLWYADGIRPEAKDPFTTNVYSRGLLTHGHLVENRNHGGSAIGLPNPMSVLDGTVRASVDIKDFTYAEGDLSLTGANGRAPVIHPGQSLKFTNLDAVAGQPAATSIYHTVTACRAPCNGLTGIAYPIANGRPGRMFDSGELGYGPAYATAAAERNTWKTPDNLPAGTYSYFCRVHPFMRGAFRVKGSRKS
jgi:plastocyanin